MASDVRSSLLSVAAVRQPLRGVPRHRHEGFVYNTMSVKDKRINGLAEYAEKNMSAMIIFFDNPIQKLLKAKAADGSLLTNAEISFEVPDADWYLT